MKSTSRTRWLSHWKTWCLLAASVIALTTFALNINRFLAMPTQRVEANILVVEGWVWDYAIESAAEEFKRGGYTLIATSGFPDTGEAEGNSTTSAESAATRLVELGVPRAKILACAAGSTWWNRTATSARAVREKILQEGVSLKKINVLTVGTHTRKTIIAYRRIMGPEVEVGVVMVPSRNFDPDRWWASRGGIYAISKNTIGWLREYLFGPRS